MSTPDPSAESPTASSGSPHLWSEQRQGGTAAPKPATVDEHDTAGWRSRFQQDYDRLLFSTPVRRLSDKTQVWPMDENDGVRTRLTHSHEVANLARSIGMGIATSDPLIFGDVGFGTGIQPLLQAIGLAHDLGNPPFGHQGEVAIGKWFENRSSWIFTHVSDGGPNLTVPVSETFRSDFTSFDGNPQSIRLVTKLQTSIGKVGLGLTAATITALLKYPVCAANTDTARPDLKKAGYFESERDVVNWARSHTGVEEGQRHPLTWIMEACDDIAYSVLDVEDAMNKRIVSPDDVLAALKATKKLQENDAIKRIQGKFEETERSDRAPSIQRGIKIAYVRTFLIDDLIRHAKADFLENKYTILGLTHGTPLMDTSPLCKRLKNLATEHAFSHPSVLRTESLGAQAIEDLMTFYWEAIADRKKVDDLRSRRNSAMAKYGFALISPNYVEAAVDDVAAAGGGLGVRYRELRLLTDMISGMTDTFAMRAWADVKELVHAYRA